ncbi:MAG: aminotransferase class I/II-fold pyridoxal phosphate-dependent enzyme [Acidimicrobiia bacterium]|nr:aminotransferase class I/II-fold pyridoxal phosphate-dependent enzyme [Acidimicrobiia bacterium]MBP8180514.1 aminotransferase class I/II-fold pyridoxal phosphate-dependent enzyme [Acidimicrobiia bacterium]
MTEPSHGPRPDWTPEHPIDGSGHGFPEGPHGGDGERLARWLGVAVERVIDLSASAHPDPPDVANLVAKNAHAALRYPDVGPATAKLAAAMGVDQDRLLLTAGGSQAIAAVARKFPNGWADRFDFSLYRQHLTLEAGGRLWASDPHNPTGILRPPSHRAAVRDEAFYPLATGTWTRGDANSIVVGSLTKTFACPGLRLGYVVAVDGEQANSIAESLPEWPVSGVALGVLIDCLDLVDLPTWAADLTEQRDRLYRLLERFGLEPTEGASATSVWVPNAPGLRRALAERAILVRGGTSFGYPDAVRIAVPDSEAMAELEDALEMCWQAARLPTRRTPKGC